MATLSISEDGRPLATTAEGIVRGLSTLGLHVFKGIPYGEDTAGANRFRPPAPVVAWSGIREAAAFGQPCYQRGANGDIGGEDCLVLNVWSPLGATNKPVMVFLHGGGYRSGSSNASLYDGEGLARRGDVVCVTVNHRLHIFGFLHLADLSGRYRGHSNVGMLDLVEALRWVKRNIAAFGGDPNNVTIFGHSGGAGKVCTLMAMPSAAGLFRRAIVQSGSQRFYRSREQATADTKAVLEFLDIDEDNVEALQTLPAVKLNEASMAVAAQIGWMGGGHCLSAMPFSPVIDPETTPFHPGSAEALALSRTVELMVGSTDDEIAIRLGPIGPAGMLKPPADADDLIANIAKMSPKIEAAQVATLPSLLARYQERMTDPWCVQLAIMSDIWMGADVIAQAQARVMVGSAPVFVYRFGWKEPCFGGSYASHGVDLVFVFDKLELKEVWGPEHDPDEPAVDGLKVNRLALRDSIVEAWSSFARSGIPTAANLPTWPAYDLTLRSTMHLDCVSKLVRDPLGREIREALLLVNAGVGA